MDTLQAQKISLIVDLCHYTKQLVTREENLFSDCPMTIHTHPRGSGRQ